jgi:myotubularin-related protein 3/4
MSRLCNTYPKMLVVPAWITDKELDTSSGFRSSRRLPVVVWRHQGNGAVIARASQPEVGWLGWRSQTDEYLIHSFWTASGHGGRPDSVNVAEEMLGTVREDPKRPSESEVGAEQTPEGSPLSDAEFLKDAPSDQQNPTKRMLIVDARSYTSAVANRAKGGGVECAGSSI